MKLTVQKTGLRQLKADAVALFVPRDKAQARSHLAVVRKLLGSRIDRIVALEQFEGKEGKLLMVHTEGKLAAPRLYLVGLGEPAKLSRESYRRAAAAAARQAMAAKAKKLAIYLPGADEHAATAAVEGAFLGAYRYDKYFTERKEERGRLAEIVIGLDSASSVRAFKRPIAEVKTICEATCLARDLANAPGNALYPETLAEAARASARKYGYRATVWDKPRIEQTGFGGLLAVSAGSARPPRFIILEHNAGRANLDTIVLVGKGVTFDAGGISIKPASGMAEMKMDMSGAAAVIGTMEAVSRLRLPLHIVGLIPSTENLLGCSAMRPGDVITHYGGKTSEVDNTDAEGRLILADALAYAATYRPKAVIDLATLTGACVVALGSHATGMMGTSEELMAGLKAAGEATFERVWPLPLYEEYEKQIKSDIADVKNVGGRWAGAITAALFLKKFAGDYPWVHLDIAGTAILEENLPYARKGGSGVGVRLLVEFLKHWKP
jgi:leucyl aminopeptidase